MFGTHEQSKGSGGQVLIVREDRLERLRAEILRLLNDLYDREHFHFTKAEMVLAFNDISMTQRDAENYLATMR